MEQLARAGAAFTGPRAKPALTNHYLEQARTDKHSALLYRIADSFGFGHEAGELVRTTYTYACSHRTEQGSLPCRVWLARILVHQCVFCISSALFRQAGGPAEKKSPGLLDDYYRYTTTGRQHLHDMPLSFRVVYILSQVIGFTASEIAAIVNAPLFTVKERYYKAQAFLLASR